MNMFCSIYIFCVYIIKIALLKLSVCYKNCIVKIVHITWVRLIDLCWIC